MTIWLSDDRVHADRYTEDRSISLRLRPVELELLARSMRLAADHHAVAKSAQDQFAAEELAMRLEDRQRGSEIAYGSPIEEVLNYVVIPGGIYGTVQATIAVAAKVRSFARRVRRNQRPSVDQFSAAAHEALMHAFAVRLEPDPTNLQVRGVAFAAEWDSAPWRFIATVGADGVLRLNRVALTDLDF